MSTETKFEYLTNCPKLTRAQEAFITDWWPMLAAGAWGFFLQEKKVPALVIDGNDLTNPFAAQPTSLIELILHIRKHNPEIKVGEVLEGWQPDKGLAVLFYDRDRATNFVTLTSDLTPPLAYTLWEEYADEDKQQQPIH